MRDNPRPAAGGRYVLDPLTGQPVPAGAEHAAPTPEVQPAADEPAARTTATEPPLRQRRARE